MKAGSIREGQKDIASIPLLLYYHRLVWLTNLSKWCAIYSLKLDRERRHRGSQVRFLCGGNVGVAVVVRVGVRGTVLVGARVSVTVRVGVAVWAGVGVTVGVCVAVAVCVAVCVLVAVAVFARVGDGVGVREGVGVGVVGMLVSRR
jgi:hypothetical protein